MRKLLIGTTIALALAAAPALASGADALRVGDRVGGTKGASKGYLPKAAVAAIAFTTLAVTVWVWDEDRHDDDSPVSL